jgi:hypothetical protein
MIARGRQFLAFWRMHGTAAALKLVRVKLGVAIAGGPVFSWGGPKPAGAGALGASGTVKELVTQRFTELWPLRTYVIPQASLPRVSVVTDSIGSGSLFGGVGTALLFAAQLANRMDATLRIVTRTEKPRAENASLILDVYGIKLLHEVQFAFAPSGDAPPRESGRPLDIHPDETFITTSWWTTAALLPDVPPRSIIYLLQEDERMFYAFGEDRLHCDEVLRNRDIRFVINTRLLHEHLIGTGLTNLSTQGQWFEPAFPKALFHERPRTPGAKRRFFFYARPNNSRNLFHVGLAAIDRAINEGVLDLDRWDVFFVGKGIPDVSFENGRKPHRVEGLDWKGYADLAGTIDLGLSLMYTPHPSYPPLDLAASGAVVVTNKFPGKEDLSGYSKNIICTDLGIDALVAALKEGVALAEDGEARRRNFLANGMGTDWTESFDEVLLSLTTER